MSGRRLISGLTAWTAALPPAPGLMASIAGSPRRLAAVWLGRTDLPGLAEVAALRPATRVLLAGFSGWIVLVLMVTLAAVMSVEMSAISLPEWLSAPSSGARAAAAQSPASFENIVQRPLFSRSRQGMTTLAAVPMPATPSPPSTLDQDITLKGIFISGPLAKAFLLSSQNPLGIWVQTDEEVSGWKVLAVQPDQVVLQGQGGKRIVQLHPGGAK
jgi:hypothetical protein